MPTIKVKINPEILKFSRERVGLSIEEAHYKIKFSIEATSKNKALEDLPAEAIQIEGLTPFIIQMTPLPTLAPLLGQAVDNSLAR